MKILRPVDIENEVRLAIGDYITTYVRPLPAGFATPSVLVTATGGTSENTIDTFTVVLDARAHDAGECYEVLTTAVGILEAQTAQQVGALRSVNINSLARWGNDPVRPDLNLCTATLVIRAHREDFTVPDES